MSIHKSKGLEFPICFVAGLGKKINFMDTHQLLVADSGLGVGTDCIQYEKRLQSKTLSKNVIVQKMINDSLEEEIRVLYVALTRAREKLILSGCIGDMKKKLITLLKYRTWQMGALPLFWLTGATSALDYVLMALSDSEGMDGLYHQFELPVDALKRKNEKVCPVRVAYISGDDVKMAQVAEHIEKEYDREVSERSACVSDNSAETSRIQRAVLRNTGVWILALSSAFMYMSRYAINEWGMFFLQKTKGFELLEASSIIAINTIAGIIGTVCAGWISDKLFKGDRKWPALTAGIMESIALVLFLYGGDGWFVNILSMVLFGIAIGVLISFIGGLMAVDLVPRKATGAALGIVGLASYAAAGIMNIISGWLIDGQAVPDPVTGELQYDFTYVSIFWVCAAVISFLLPILNWGRKKQEI